MSLANEIFLVLGSNKVNPTDLFLVTSSEWRSQAQKCNSSKPQSWHSWCWDGMSEFFPQSKPCSLHKAVKRKLISCESFQFIQGLRAVTKRHTTESWYILLELPSVSFGYLWQSNAAEILSKYDVNALCLSIWQDSPRNHQCWFTHSKRRLKTFSVFQDDIRTMQNVFSRMCSSRTKLMSRSTLIWMQ